MPKKQLEKHNISLVKICLKFTGFHTFDVPVQSFWIKASEMTYNETLNIDYNFRMSIRISLKDELLCYCPFCSYEYNFKDIIITEIAKYVSAFIMDKKLN